MTTLDGLISFFASHHAIRADTMLKRSNFAAELIPGPKELSPNCGVALRFEYARREAAMTLLEQKRVQINGVHFYQPRTDAISQRISEGVEPDRSKRPASASPFP